jgi:hypothetical protein
MLVHDCPDRILRYKGIVIMIRPHNILYILAFLILSLCATTGCAPLFHTSTGEGIPILSQDELSRPYTKMGRIQVTRETFGPDYSLTPDIKAWGFAALRQEAEKMGADGVILPEVSGHTTTSGLIPSTEYRATGIAIKFK